MEVDGEQFRYPQLRCRKKLAINYGLTDRGLILP
jgi:hypothetical protein